MAGTAVQKLQPSRLTSQLEVLADDIDVVELNLARPVAASYHLRAAVTDGDITRTINGPSTLELTVRDRDRSLLNSGILDQASVQAGVDLKIDGLWFRLAAHEKRGNDVILTFEDREVALLKKYPLKSKPATWWRSWATADVTRTQFARSLIQDVKNAGELDIRFVATESKNPTDAIASSADRKDATTKQAERQPGFPPDADVTVKGETANREQRDNIARVLDVGISLGLSSRIPSVDRLVLVSAVMVITQESTAYNLRGGDLDSVGLFQQRASQGWPATRDVETDARAYYDRAIAYIKDHQTVDAATLASRVQHDYTAGTAREGADYARWRTEAEHTVDEYFGFDDPTSPAGSAVDLSVDTSGTVGFFTRGRTKTVNRKKVKVRESDWACLQRLAQEVGWRCFCVSGTVYFCSDGHLFQSAPRMTISEQTDGVDSIDYEWDTGKRNATVTVTCRIGRWAAPPGSVVAIVDTDPVNGRWLVSKIERSLFSPQATITLEKPQPVIPEAQTPEFSSGTDDTLGAFTGGVGPADQTRGRIVAAARKALAKKSQFHYRQVRPMPAGLFADNPEYIDCSAFFTLCYKAAGAPDPNGAGYNGTGYTGTLVANGRWVTTPNPGDACFYGSSRGVPGHVTVYVGAGRCISMGQEGDPVELDAQYRSDFLGYMAFPLGTTVQASGESDPNAFETRHHMGEA